MTVGFVSDTGKGRSRGESNEELHLSCERGGSEMERFFILSRFTIWNVAGLMFVYFKLWITRHSTSACITVVGVTLMHDAPQHMLAGKKNCTIHDYCGLQWWWFSHVSSVSFIIVISIMVESSPHWPFVVYHFDQMHNIYSQIHPEHHSRSAELAKLAIRPLAWATAKLSKCNFSNNRHIFVRYVRTVRIHNNHFGTQRNGDIGLQKGPAARRHRLPDRRNKPRGQFQFITFWISE